MQPADNAATATAELDHLIVATDELARGVAHVEQSLGITCRPGGRHPGLGTHNALARLGEHAYIEVIAIDPDAPPATMPRWFGLDDPAVQARLAERPRLLTWVARSDDLDAAVAACRHEPGSPRAMRRGDLHWRIAFPGDGRLLEGGLVPPLIEWAAPAEHPAFALPDTGLELVELQAAHPQPECVRTTLEALGLARWLTLRPDESAATVASAPVGLRAVIDTPDGRRWLD